MLVLTALNFHENCFAETHQILLVFSLSFVITFGCVCSMTQSSYTSADTSHVYCFTIMIRYDGVFSIALEKFSIKS